MNKEIKFTLVITIISIFLCMLCFHFIKRDYNIGKNLDNKINSWRMEENIRPVKELIEEIDTEKITEIKVDMENKTIKRFGSGIPINIFTFDVEAVLDNEKATVNRVKAKINTKGEKGYRFNSIDELENFIKNIIINKSENEKEDVLIEMEKQSINQNEFEILNMQDLMNYYNSNKIIEEPTKESFIKYLEKNNDTIESYIIKLIKNNKGNDIITPIGTIDFENLIFKYYKIINPDGKLLSEYYATENGEYKFKIIDIRNNDEVTRTINVMNIGEIEKNNVLSKDNYGNGTCNLENKDTKEQINIKTLLVEVNDEYIEVDNDLIKNENDNTYFLKEDIEKIKKDNEIINTDNNDLNIKIIDENERMYYFDEI